MRNSDLDSNGREQIESFAKHDRLGPLEQLKAEVGELTDLSFIDGLKDENGFTVYTGYMNSEGKRQGLG